MMNTILALCGNKCDLPKEAWVVETEVAQKYATMNQLIFYETSAKENINIQEVFYELAKQYFSTGRDENKPKAIEKESAPATSRRGCC